MNNSLEQQLWDSFHNLKKDRAIYNMGSDFKNYFLGIITYKYLSEKLEVYLNRELEQDKLTFREAWEDIKYKEVLNKASLDDLGYFIEPDYLFENVFLSDSRDLTYNLNYALNLIGKSSLGHESEEDFANIFEDVNVDSTKLGKTVKERAEIIFKIMSEVNEIDFKVDDPDKNHLGKAYEYLISHLALESKKGANYTPLDLSVLLSRIISLENKSFENVYDPCCGSASSLLVLNSCCEVKEMFAQEINRNTYNLARMNMILHGIDFRKYDIELGDCLEDPAHSDYKFDAILSHPPFTSNWSADKSFFDDERFASYSKLAPKSKPHLAFVQHMIYHLDDKGTMAVILPHGVLFRGASEGLIRSEIIEKNYLHAVIGLPSNLLYGTAIPVVVLVFKKSRENSDVLFIDASSDFEKDRFKNVLTDKHIDKIVDVLDNFKEIDHYSAVVSLDEISENRYNLHIPRYVDTFIPEESVDVDRLYKRLDEISDDLKDINHKIDAKCDKLKIRKFSF